MLLRTLLVFWLAASPVRCMYMPQDVEILDGYDLEESGEYYPSSDSSSYYEARSLAAGRTKSIHQHPLSKDVEVFDVSKKLETRRSVPELPTAEKQTMDVDYYRNRDYSTYWKQHNGDSMPEASSNEGMRGRTPRVNFITQPKKSDDSKDRPIPAMSKPMEFERFSNANYDLYPSRSYDQYLRRYDRYDDQYSRYDPHNYEDYYIRRRHYDPYDSYSPRTPSYPDPYYDYPDRRYDIPEPREFHPLYTNDIHERALKPTLSSYGSRRVIYYAHLPEVVRTPVSIDYSNRNLYPYDAKRYDDYRQAAPTTAQAFMKREKKFGPAKGSGPTAKATNADN